MLLATTDLHMAITPRDPLTGRHAPGTGLALAVAEAREAARNAANALLFDIGDAFQGSPVDDALMAPDGPHPHPMAAALDAASMAAATLGNHDFNHGLPALDRALSSLRTPVVLANIVRARGPDPTRDTPYLPPFVLIERDLRCSDGRCRPIRIGVLGLAPPQTLGWDADKLAGHLVARDIVETAVAWVPRMRAAGADLIVALCHSGIGPAKATPGMEHAAVPLAAIEGVDVVLAGHAHRLFPDDGFEPAACARAVVDPRRGTLHGKPAVMAGHGGRHLGVVTLALSADGPGGGWRVAEARTHLRRVTARRPNPEVLSAAGNVDRFTRTRLARRVGRIEVPVETYFARVRDSVAVRLINAAQMAAVRAALAGRPEAALPLVSVAAPLRCGGPAGEDAYTDIPAGEVTERDLADLYPYPNTLQAAFATGADLRALLEAAAAQFRTVRPGTRDAPLIDEAVPAYGFDCVAGVSYRIDVTAPVGDRLRDLRHAGRPVRAEDRFVLATNSFRTGSDADGPRPFLSLGPTRTALARHLASGGAADALAPPSWGFVPVADTTALFRTGRGAARHVPRASAQVLSRIAPAPHGGTGKMETWRLDLSRADLLVPAAQDLHKFQA